MKAARLAISSSDSCEATGIIRAEFGPIRVLLATARFLLIEPPRDSQLPFAQLTARTFLRRFSAATGMTPVEYLQQVRVAKAREALEQTSTLVDRVGWEIGYADPAAFRKIFQKLTGLAPSVYRQKFGIASRFSSTDDRGS